MEFRATDNEGGAGAGWEVRKSVGSSDGRSGQSTAAEGFSPSSSFRLIFLKNDIMKQIHKVSVHLPNRNVLAIIPATTESKVYNNILFLMILIRKKKSDTGTLN